ncbi:MAG: CYTH domain-containing protein [Muribaculaceae bacterium]|nr:CYTH domain-containing protein [Muribaculaceae bacterium]
MAFEIEHKYLVTNDAFRQLATSEYRISQGYLSRNPDRTVRVRVKGDRGYLTVKGKNDGAVRREFEYEIPLKEAEELLGMCESPVIEKIRFLVPFEGKIWEVDEFFGSKTGLVTAEIELVSADEQYDLPPFVGENVTGNPAYYNSNLL